LIQFDTSILLGYYQSKTGQAGSGAGASAAAASSTKTQYAPTAPWATNSTYLRASDLVKNALLGKRLIDENAAKLDLPGASDDYKKLFSLYQGLNTLYGVAEQASAKHVSALDLSKYTRVFERGMTETNAYADGLDLDQLRLTRGEVGLSAKAAIGVPKTIAEYTTATIYSGASSEEVPAFAGDVQFTLSAKKLNTTQAIDVDLNDMGSTPRTMSNVTSFINGKLADAGLTTRFSVVRTAGVPKTITAGGKTTTLPAGPDTYAFKIKGDTTEKLTFSAADAKPALYISSVTGNPDPDKNRLTDDAVLVSRLTKLNSDVAGVPDSGSRVFSQDLEGTIGTVHASKTGPDGSLYMLADIDTSVAGQTVKGESDVALLKYDSAGKLIYARTLGASDKATGLALDVSSDGKVAVAGSVTGVLQGATNGALNSSATSGLSDSFVTLYDASGDEVWTERRGAQKEDEATAVAFGGDGTVYVGGRTKSPMPAGSDIVGGWDSYLTAYATSAKGTPTTLFTKTFGTESDDKITGIVVDGDTVTTAGVEGGHGVLRSFDMALTTTSTSKTINADGTWTQTVTTSSGGTPGTPVVTTGSTVGDGNVYTTTSNVTSAATATAGATRDLGDLGGGAIAGLVLDDGELYIGGSTRNPALAAGTPSTAYSGGLDGFALRLSTDLTSTASDQLAYVGGAGDDTVTAMTATGGKVWLTGSAGDDLGGAPIGTKDGFVSQVDLNDGAVDWTERLSGKDGYAAPTAIAVGATGASALDKLGLPSGTIDYTRSPSIVSATSIRAGDSFQIVSGGAGVAKTITIEAKDTLETLAAKVRRATSFQAKVEVVSDGTVRKLKITPLNDNSTIEILPGKGGDDGLTALGLSPGISRKTDFVDGKTVSADGKGPIYGLKLTQDLDLSTETGRANALKVLGDALGVIRTAYRDLQTAAMPKSATATAKSASGPVPAYLTAQIANYNAALSRLSGG
jgi:hypothetical protein